MIPMFASWNFLSLLQIDWLLSNGSLSEPTGRFFFWLIVTLHSFHCHFTSLSQSTQAFHSMSVRTYNILLYEKKIKYFSMKTTFFVIIAFDSAVKHISHLINPAAATLSDQMLNINQGYASSDSAVKTNFCSLQLNIFLLINNFSCMSLRLLFVVSDVDSNTVIIMFSDYIRYIRRQKWRN